MCFEVLAGAFSKCLSKAFSELDFFSVLLSISIAEKVLFFEVLSCRLIDLKEEPEEEWALSDSGSGLERFVRLIFWLGIGT